VREYYKYSGPGLCTGPLRARRSLAGGGRGGGGKEDVGLDRGGAKEGTCGRKGTGRAGATTEDINQRAHCARG